ncbi:unnamed protein product [Urochloa humidicola]
MAAPPPKTTAISAAAVLLLCAAALLGAADAAAGGRLLKATAPAAAAARNDAVTIACANATSRSHHYPGPGLTMDFCEITLWSDKRAASAAHPRDLALLALDLVRDGAAGAAASEKKKLSRDTALNLRYCQLDYEAVARTVPVCREMVEEYSPGADGEGPPMIPYNYLECAGRVARRRRPCGRRSPRPPFGPTSPEPWSRRWSASWTTTSAETPPATTTTRRRSSATTASSTTTTTSTASATSSTMTMTTTTTTTTSSDGTHHVIDDDDDDDDSHHVGGGSHHVIDDDNHHRVVDDDDDD